MNLKLTIIFLLLCITNNSYCNDSKSFTSNNSIPKNENIAINLKAGLNNNWHTANFKKFENAVGCNVFKRGEGTGEHFSIGIEKNASKDLQVGFDFLYVNRSAILSHDTTFSFRDFANDIRDGTARYTLDANLHYLELAPNLKLVLLSNFIKGPLRLFVGWRFMIPLKYEFEQNERIISPDDLYFILADSSFVRERKLASGSIGSISTFGKGVSFGLENLIKLSSHLYWTQQIGFDSPVSNITYDAFWVASSINFSTGLRYSFHKKEHQKEYVELPIEDKIITIETPSEPLIATAPILEIEPLGFDGIIETGTELLATAPIVNAVFFENNSSELPLYLKFDKLSYEAKYKMNPIKLHDYILVQIAEILENNPAATLSLIGATAGKQHEPKGLTLAEERAKVIKNQFAKLGIDEKRIKTFAKLLPDFPSNNKFEEGVKENQRVDIIVNNAPLQEYVNFLLFERVKGNQNYKIKVENVAKNFSLYSSLADSTVKIFNDDSIFIFDINKQISNADENFLIHQTTLYSSSLNRKIVDTIDLKKLERKTIATNYSNFLAILRFDYNSSILSKENQELLKQMANFLPENCTLEIFGSADLLGSAARNDELTKKRANAAMNFLNSLKKHRRMPVNYSITNQESIDEIEKFDESTPQGRMLNRSIFIRIKQR